MKKFNKLTLILLPLFSLLILSNCKDDPIDKKEEKEEDTITAEFYFGADLSYVNQILDHNGSYRDGGEERSPDRIFKDHGTSLVRLRLWHNPVWTKDVY